MKQLEGQMTLELFAERVPFHCPDEGAVAAIGGGKSFCIPWNCWTNCREYGSCVYEKWHNK